MLIKRAINVICQQQGVHTNTYKVWKIKLESEWNKSIAKDEQFVSELSFAAVSVNVLVLSSSWKWRHRCMFVIGTHFLYLKHACASTRNFLLSAAAALFFSVSPVSHRGKKEKGQSSAGSEMMCHRSCFRLNIILRLKHCKMLRRA